MKAKGIIVSKKELFGLLIVFIGYVLLGGLVFMLLESPLEEKLRREIEELRNEFQGETLLLYPLLKWHSSA
ncbi:hypothetical protein CDAR_374871 [Caerostris darwini]|uniref:Uncharacterized protein n=1 Tax=Caerostris darwini TaxID=1538125 RepID=A0AAV4RP70_9ARAC|nr:hypothetical protein CDAR_374871 [Caerostris darwini]